MLSNDRVQTLGQALAAVAMSALLLALAAGCGVSFGATDDETEVFKSLTVEGDFRLGGVLTMTLEVEQPYAADVPIVCELLDDDAPATATVEPDATATPVAFSAVGPTPQNKVRDLIRKTIFENPDGGIVDEVTPVPETLEREFDAPEEAGRYEIECYTPADDNNAISTKFTIAPVLAR